jgi:exosortase
VQIETLRIASIERWRRDALFTVFTLSLLVLMAGPIKGLVGFVLDFNNSAASHIVVIPFISAALIYVNRKEIFQSVAYSVLPGTLVLMLGMALFIVGKIFGSYLDKPDKLSLFVSSLVVLWLGGFLFFYGGIAFKAALFPLLFLVFCIPIPSPVLDRTITFLQYRSADMAYVLLKLTGTPIHRQGIIFLLPDLIIGVEPQCSGIRSGISLFISSLVAGYVLLQSFWRRGVLLLAAVPILIFKNALRIGVLTYLAIHVDKRILTSQLHREGGIPFFVLGLIFLTPFLAMLVRFERKRAKEAIRAMTTIQSMPMRPREAGDLLERGNV